MTGRPAQSASALARWKDYLIAVLGACMQPGPGPDNPSDAAACHEAGPPARGRGGAGMAGRAVLAACRAIAVACLAAALLTPSRFLALAESSLLALLAVIVIAAWWRRCCPAGVVGAFPRALFRARARRPADPGRHHS